MKLNREGIFLHWYYIFYIFNVTTQIIQIYNSALHAKCEYYDCQININASNGFGVLNVIFYFRTAELTLPRSVFSKYVLETPSIHNAVKKLSYILDL